MHDKKNIGSRTLDRSLVTFSIRAICPMLVIGVMLLISMPVGANTDPPAPSKSRPAPLPPTIPEKVMASPYIILGQVERVDYTLLSGRPREYKVLDYMPIGFGQGEQEILSIKVLEVLKWPGEKSMVDQVKLLHREGSSRKYFLDRYSPGSQWVFFIDSVGIFKSDPPEFFGAGPLFIVPAYRRRMLPEPASRLSEVRRAFGVQQKEIH